VFQLNKCIEEDEGQAYFRGKAVKLISGYVDSDLKVAVVLNNRIQVVDLMDLSNKDQHELSQLVWQEDVDYNNYSKWKAIT